jgi:hypothetical protein
MSKGWKNGLLSSGFSLPLVPCRPWVIILRDGEVTSRSQSLIDVEEIPIFEATAKNIRALATDTCQHY